MREQARQLPTKTKFAIVCWRILRASPVFRYWYRKHLTELMFDLELHRNIEQKEIEDKYRKKLQAYPWKRIKTQEKR